MDPFKEALKGLQIKGSGAGVPYVCAPRPSMHHKGQASVVATGVSVISVHLTNDYVGGEEGGVKRPRGERGGVRISRKRAKESANFSSSYPRNAGRPYMWPYEGSIGLDLSFNYWVSKDEGKNVQILTKSLKDLMLAAATGEAPQQDIGWTRKNALTSLRGIVVGAATGVDTWRLEKSLLGGRLPFLRKCSSVPTRNSNTHGQHARPNDAHHLANLMLWAEVPPLLPADLASIRFDTLMRNHVVTFEAERFGERGWNDELLFHYEPPASGDDAETANSIQGWFRKGRTGDRGQWTLTHSDDANAIEGKHWIITLSWGFRMSTEKDILVVKVDEQANGDHTAPASLVFETKKVDPVLEEEEVPNEHGNWMPKETPLGPLELVLMKATPSALEAPIEISPLVVVAKLGDEPTPRPSHALEDWEVLEVSFTGADVEEYSLTTAERYSMGIPMHLEQEGDGYVTTSERSTTGIVPMDIAINGASEHDSDDDGCVITPCEVPEEGEEQEEGAISAPDIEIGPIIAVDGCKLIGLDCEMVVTSAGLELCRCTLVGVDGNTLYDVYVRPSEPVLNYLTEYSGITEEHLKGATLTLADVQRHLLKAIDSKTYLVGHSLDSDLKALRLVHGRLIDTAALYPSPRGAPFKMGLRKLGNLFLGRDVQAGHGDSGHDSRMDALAALELALLKIAKGPDFGIPTAWACEPTPPRESVVTTMRRTLAARPAPAPSKQAHFIGGVEAEGAKVWTRYAHGYRRETDAVWVGKQAVETEDSHMHVTAEASDAAGAIAKGCEKLKAASSPSLLWIDLPCREMIDEDQNEGGDLTGSDRRLWESLEDMDKGIEELYEAAPSGTLVMVICQGNTDRLRALQQAKQQGRWQLRAAEQNTSLAGSLQPKEWSNNDEEDLNNAAEEIVHSVAFFAVKK